MRKLRVKCPKMSLLTITRSRQWTAKLVYILAANKCQKYPNGRSRIIYIGTTKKDTTRPAVSAVNKASEAFGKLHGVKEIEVHIATCGARKAIPTWKRLEASLLHEFRNIYFDLPKYNKVRPKPNDGLFTPSAIRKMLKYFEH